MNLAGNPKNLIPWKKISWRTGGVADGGSTVIRVPKHLAATVLDFAHRLDVEAAQSQTTQLTTQQGEFAGVEILKPEGHEKDPNFDEVAWEKEMQPEIEAVAADIQAIQNGTFIDNNLAAKTPLSEREIESIHNKIESLAGYDVEYYAEIQAKKDTLARFGAPDWIANNAKNCRDPETGEIAVYPEIDAYQLERFTYHYQVASAIWDSALQKDHPTEPNYHRIQVEPICFEPTAEWLIQQNDGTAESVERLARTWVAKAIEKEAIHWVKLNPQKMDFSGDELTLGEIEKMTYFELCQHAEFLRTGIENLDCYNPEPRSWFAMQSRRFTRAIENIIQELNRLGDNAIAMGWRKRPRKQNKRSTPVKQHIDWDAKPSKGFGEKQTPNSKQQAKLAKRAANASKSGAKIL